MLEVIDEGSSTAGPPQFEMWMRTPPVEPDLPPALTAYATDLTLWFHRPFRTDQWLLLRQRSPVMAHGRCFGSGEVLTEQGSLVASYAQEALLRFP
jgi:acyl-CoA thioesterase-2